MYVDFKIKAKGETLAKNRLIFQNWLVDIGYDPKLGGPHKNEIEQISIDELFESGFDITQEIPDSRQKNRAEIIEEAVKKALAKLNDDEREFIIRFHFMGERYIEIAEKSERKMYSLVSMHNIAIKKLRRYLKQFVKEQFSINEPKQLTCLICNSPYKQEINKLILERDPTSTWKHIIQHVSKTYNIKIKSPQILIGHEKYH